MYMHIDIGHSILGVHRKLYNTVIVVAFILFQKLISGSTV